MASCHAEVHLYRRLPAPVPAAVPLRPVAPQYPHARRQARRPSRPQCRPPRLTLPASTEREKRDGHHVGQNRFGLSQER
uniref:Uncharacterized protein n=1 Tax=Oryza nivara TaxID=4536 RepID=A0A0E0G5I0_ORYNI